MGEFDLGASMESEGIFFFFFVTSMVLKKKFIGLCVIMDIRERLLVTKEVDLPQSHVKGQICNDM